MDIMGKMKAQQTVKTEAIEAKASEYAALSARVERLESSITSLESTLQDMTTALQGITPQKIEQFQQAGEGIFDPLKATAAELANDIQEAGEDAIRSIKAAGDTGINWKGRIVSAFFIALFFLIGQFAIQYHFTPSEDYAKRILWNIQYRGENGENTVNFFDSEESAKAKYDNQKRYEDTQKLKAQQEQRQNQK